MLKRYQHNPTHLFLDDTAYFITAAIHAKRLLLGTHEVKLMMRETLQAVFEQYGWQLFHWVILDNHYHLCYPWETSLVTPLNGSLQGGSCICLELSNFERLPGRAGDLPMIIIYNHSGIGYKQE